MDILFLLDAGIGEGDADLKLFIDNPKTPDDEEIEALLLAIFSKTVGLGVFVGIGDGVGVFAGEGVDVDVFSFSKMGFTSKFCPAEKF